MALTLRERKIRRVRLVDDDPSARNSYKYAVEDLDIEPDPVAGPLRDIKTFIKQTKTRADAALIDFHLRKRNYAGFDGAKPTAVLNKCGFPAVLCTRWADADIDEIRPFRQYIPVLLRPDELDPDSLAQGFERCLAEYQGDVLPSRKTWRTLVRVEDVENEDKPRFFFIVVPAWDPKEVVRVRFADVPSALRETIRPSKRLHAHINIGAEDQEELYFRKWESD